MAQAISNKKISILFKFALLVSLLLMIITTADSRAIFGAKMELASSKLACESVVGVESGDTCFGIAQSNHLTANAFIAINPNVNCTALFVGQWLCVDASTN